MYDYAVIANLVGFDTRLIEMAGRIANLHQDARVVGNWRAQGAIVIPGRRAVNTHRIGGTHGHLGILLKVGHATLLLSSALCDSIPRNIHALPWHHFHGNLRLFFYLLTTTLTAL